MYVFNSIIKRARTHTGVFRNQNKCSLSVTEKFTNVASSIGYNFHFAELAKSRENFAKLRKKNSKRTLLSLNVIF